MYENLKNALNESNKIVFFSGAGMSTASGIPDFRSSTGLYKNIYRAEEMVSHTAFKTMTYDFFEFYRKHLCFKDALPNYGHKYIARLEKTKDVTVITQNIDNLHQIAGSSNVLELHGSIMRNYCVNCHKSYSLDHILQTNGIPYCSCGGVIKPDVVLYEEGLDENVIYKTIDAIRNADMMIILGTSLSVYPAASFIRYFKGKTLAIINKTKTSQDENCDIVIHDDINNVFMQIDS